MLDLDTVADGGGAAIGACGAPQYGKTTLLKRVLDAMRAQGICQAVVIHDVKKAGIPQYEGAPCASLAEFMGSGDAYATESTIVFNGPDWRNPIPLQDVCEVGIAVHEGGTRVAVVADEIFKGTNGRGDFLKGPKGENNVEAPALFPLLMREGTSQGISTLWTTQIPQQLPTECKVLTQSVALFHLENLSADAACDKFRLDEHGRDVLESLQRGEFVIYRTGRNWDRTIYGPH